MPAFALPLPGYGTLLQKNLHQFAYNMLRIGTTSTVVAQQACLSPVYFSSLFRKYTGFSYVQYLNIRKVNCAKMLLESGLSVTETCYTAGFGSASAFLHTFKQLTGLSPNAYRQQLFKDKRLI